MRIGNLNKRLITKEIDKDNIPNLLDGKNQRYIFPFVITLGTINNSELGEITGNIEPSDFNQYSRIFTGKDNVIETWKGSTSCVKPTEDSDHLIKEFTEGEAYQVFIDQEAAAISTTPAGQDASFASQQAQVQVTAIVEGQVFNYNSLFEHYYIPATGTKAFFEIEQLITYLDKQDKKVVLQEIVFSSVNDKLASTGQAVDQYLQYGAPGEGYAWPIENVEEQNYSLDESKLLNNPITSLQIELFGGGVFNSPLIMGRKVDSKDDGKISTPKLLFPYKMEVPQPSEISKTTGGENNFYFIAEGNPETIAYYKNWKDNYRDNYDFTAQRNYEGVLETIYEEVIATNPVTGGSKLDIYDETWNITTGEKTVDVSAISLFGDDEITLAPIMKVPDLLMFSSAAFIDTLKLPIGKEETTIWSAKDIPIVGGFLNILSLGIPWGGTTTTAKITAKPIMGFIPATLYEFSEQALNTGEARGLVPLDTFRNDTDDTVSGAIGANMISTVFKFSLTDRVQKNGDVLDTKDLGQKPENGGWTFGVDGVFVERPADPNLSTTDGFIIDYIGRKGLAKLDYKWTAYRYDYPLFQVKKQSRSKFTNSVREWDNGQKMSNWEEKNGETVDYPEAIIPKPPTSGYGDLQFNIDSQNRGIVPLGTIPFETFERSTQITFDLGDYGNLTWDDVIAKYSSIDLNLGKIKLYVDDSYNYEQNASTESIPISTLVENTTYVFSQYEQDVNMKLEYNYYVSNSSGVGCYPRTAETEQKGKVLYRVEIVRVGLKVTVTTIVGNPIAEKIKGNADNCGASNSIYTAYEHLVETKNIKFRA